MGNYRVKLKWNVDVVMEADSKEKALKETIAWMDYNYFTDVYEEDIEVISIEEVE